MLLQNPFFWYHLVDFKGLSRSITVVAAVALAAVLIYIGLVQGRLYYGDFLALPIIIFAFLYGLPGGVIASLAIVIPLYIWSLGAGVSKLTNLLLIGLVSGILREGLNWQTKQLEALGKIDVAILSGASLREVTNLVVDKVTKLLGVDDVRIFLYERDTDELVIYQDFLLPPPADYAIPRHWKPGEAIPGIVFKEKVPIIIRDIWSDPRVISGERLKKMGLRSALSVPLMVGQEATGVFTVFSRAKRDFSKREIKAMKGLAGQLAIALEAARANKEVEKRAARFSALFALDSAILAQRSLNEVLNLAARLAAELMKADSCFIGFVDEKTQTLSVKAHYGYLDEEVEAIERVRLKVGEGAAGWAVLQKQPVAIPDVRNDPRFVRLLPLVEGVETAAVLAAPLVTGGKVIGAISLRYSGRRSFSDEEVEFIRGFAGQIAIAIKQAEFVKRLQEASLETIRALMISLDARDPYTAGHSERVAQYSVGIAARMGFAQDKLQLLEYAGLLHDVGKIGCAEAAWQKPGKLDDGEMAEMKKHSYVSSQILKSISFLKETAPWIYHHHERYDGLGYPDRLKGTEIPLESRILLVADAYDAMTSSRPYRSALGKERALAELAENAGKQFDPQVAWAALEVFSERNQQGRV